MIVDPLPAPSREDGELHYSKEPDVIIIDSKINTKIPKKTNKTPNEIRGIGYRTSVMSESKSEEDIIVKLGSRGGKTRLCRAWMDGRCDLRRKDCRYAHGKSDLHPDAASECKFSDESEQKRRSSREKRRRRRSRSRERYPLPYERRRKRRRSSSLEYILVREKERKKEQLVRFERLEKENLWMVNENDKLKKENEVCKKFVNERNQDIERLKNETVEKRIYEEKVNENLMLSQKIQHLIGENKRLKEKNIKFSQDRKRLLELNASLEAKSKGGKENSDLLKKNEKLEQQIQKLRKHNKWLDEKLKRSETQVDDLFRVLRKKIV